MFGRKAAPTSSAPRGGLDAAASRRLDRFADLFDDVAAPDYTMFEGPAVPDERLQTAMDTALFALGTSRRRDAVKEAVARFVDAAQQRYSERFSISELFAMGVRTASPDDRVRVFKSLERAVVALALWDQIDDETRSALAGPWGVLVERAVGDE